jgi:hypothetical protein
LKIHIYLYSHTANIIIPIQTPSRDAKSKTTNKQKQNKKPQRLNYNLQTMGSIRSLKGSMEEMYSKDVMKFPRSGCVVENVNRHRTLFIFLVINDRALIHTYIK